MNSMPAKAVLNKGLSVTAITVVALSLSAFMAVAPAADAAVYSWNDDAGGMHFTDDPMAVPRKYKDKTQVREDGGSNRSWEYLASDSGADFSYDTLNVSYMNRNRYRVNIKESYAYAGREEYETQIILDCARQTYRPTQSIRIYRNQRSPVEMRGGGEQDTQWGSQDVSRRLSYPFQLLARILCRDSQR